jgi:hypothetical protein
MQEAEWVYPYMSRFWWGRQQNERKISWMSWKRMGVAKARGGLGFRDLELFNLALLAKQGWRILQNPDSLVARVFKEKYFPSESFMQATLGNSPSYAWRSIFNARRFLKEVSFGGWEMVRR